MSTHNTSAALRKCRGCGKVYAEDAPHPCTGGSDPYTAGMTIEEARRIYGSTDGKSPGVKAAEEADRVQLVEALAEHPGTPWGEAIEKVATLRLEREADVMTALMRQSEAFDVTLGIVTRERDELRAALLNERGEGEPPSEGWARNDFDRRAVGIAWYRPSNADGSPPPTGAMDYAYALWVYREPTEPEWTWECEHADFSSRNIQGKAPTAREAMRAADTALAGAKS